MVAKTIMIYPKDKPRFNTYFKHKLRAKQDVYKDNYNDKYKKTRYATEKAIITSNTNHLDKLGENLTTNNSKNIS